MEAYRSKLARRYDREFKENAVALIQSGRTITEVARDLGVSHWSLSRWVKDVQAGKIPSQPTFLTLSKSSRASRRSCNFSPREITMEHTGLGSETHSSIMSNPLVVARALLAHDSNAVTSFGSACAKKSKLSTNLGCTRDRRRSLSGA